MEDFLKLKPDHRAILTKTPEDYNTIKQFLQMVGYVTVYNVDRIGEKKTGMATFACRHPMTGDCLAIIYGMSADDESSHAQAPFDFGTGGDKAKKAHSYTQHFAMRTKNIIALRKHLEDKGARFLTPIYDSADTFGPLKQSFTYELFDDEWFFIEITQRDYDVSKITGGGAAFSDETVRALYNTKQADFRNWLKTKKKMMMFSDENKTKKEIKQLLEGLEPKGFAKLVPALSKIIAED